MTASSKRAQWLCHPLPDDVAAALERVSRTDDVLAVAVMPDVHLARDVCIGTVVGTGASLFPDAVGGDIGCGMRAMAFDVDADVIDERRAASLFEALYDRIPILRHRVRGRAALPRDLAERPLSTPALESRKTRQAGLQLGTVGRGNHFVELQRDEAGALWAMVHSGSRGMGPAIREHHLCNATADAPTGLRSLKADDAAGRAYLQDVAWARAYAEANRRELLAQVAGALQDVVGANPLEPTTIDCDHNHVGHERHGGRMMWLHRKGAQSARLGELGIIPGSMGQRSHHVEGRGCDASLASASHGAGRSMSRSEARVRVSRRTLARDMRGVFFDHRLLERLREEAPSAYKDIGAVMRAQRELVRVVRTLWPVLSFKGV